MTQQGTAPSTRVFIDTNLFVYHLIGDIAAVPKDLVQKSRRFFKDIENQKYLGTVTTFTKTEYTGVWKGLMSKQATQSVTPVQISTARQKYENFISRMGLEIFDANDLVASKVPINFFAETDDRVVTATPTLGKYDRKWHTLKGADGLITVFAERVNSTYIASADDDFKGIKSSVKLLNIREAY